MYLILLLIMIIAFLFPYVYINIKEYKYVNKLKQTYSFCLEEKTDVVKKLKLRYQQKYEAEFLWIYGCRVIVLAFIIGIIGKCIGENFYYEVRFLGSIAIILLIHSTMLKVLRHFYYKVLLRLRKQWREN